MEIGLIVENISFIPLTIVYQYRFIGTWEKVKEGYKLTNINWQNIYSGKIITNKEINEIRNTA